MKPILTTERLILRELAPEDVEKLALVLSNPISMQHYPHPFSRDEVTQWITWNIDNYRKYGFGLWGVIRKETGELIGDCGVTMQEIDGELCPEIGYHIRMDHCGNGYASEAASACMEYAFSVLKMGRVYSYMKKDNIPSRKVAENNGMVFQKEFRKTVYGETVDEVVYAKDA